MLLYQGNRLIAIYIFKEDFTFTATSIILYFLGPLVSNRDGALQLPSLEKHRQSSNFNCFAKRNSGTEYTNYNSGDNF